ncbi:MAG: SH3 domain-containing protein [Nodosilinea sp.]
MKFVYKSLALACGGMLLVSLAAPTLAQSTAELLETAEAACIENAAEDGYDPAQAEVISSRALDADKVEVVLNLTKDGQGFDRLTCPFSASQGIGNFVGDTAGAVAAPGLGRLWWLLVPLIGLPLLLWALRGRDRDYAAAAVGDRVYTEGYVNTTEGPLDVREYPNSTSRVLRTLTNGEHVRLTGNHDNDWVELFNGGWVPSYYLRYADDVSRRV